MILVTGATGNVGRQVVAQLVAAGEPVRALSRHPERAGWPDGVERVAGDLTQELPAGLFAGVDALYLFPEPSRVDEVVADAAAAGVRHAVVLSSMAAGASDEGLEVLQRRHLDVERAVEASPLTWTHVRPGMFMTNTLGWAESVRTADVVRDPYPDATAAPVHEADIAAVAVAALLEPDRHAGRAYALTGPEALSQRDRVRVLAEVLGRPVRFEERSREQARAALLTNPWMNERLADSLLDMLAASSGVREGAVLPGVRDVLGRAPLDFATWVDEHRAAFTATA
ncbi:NAD(P)H-binding protein [Microlunatus spumicola]|uniref:NAD(P)H-binding protein n=1 Tax=Microlunatus spumicola TaxID=81499 RepID=A0ABP6X4I4_9ACTN